jgi:hypothetical protein
MTRFIKGWLWLCLCAMVVLGTEPQTTLRADTVLTNADVVALAAAVEDGGTIKLGFTGTVALTEALTVAKDTTLDATGYSVVLDGENQVRHFVVTNGAALTLMNVTLSNGTFHGQDGTVVDQPGGWALGGSILNLGGKLQLIGCVFLNNSALAGYAGDYIFAFPNGGAAYGGAIYSIGGANSSSARGWSSILKI